jgi:hypothetical protein
MVGCSEPPKIFLPFSRFKKVILVFDIYNYSGVAQR